MAHTNKVVRSIESGDGRLCVDVFRRPDKTYGFEEYRRDAEDTDGWRPVGNFGGRRFTSVERALGEARQSVPWLVSERQ